MCVGVSVENNIQKKESFAEEGGREECTGIESSHFPARIPMPMLMTIMSTMPALTIMAKAMLSSSMLAPRTVTEGGRKYLPCHAIA
jgi:hypothetical protein